MELPLSLWSSFFLFHFSQTTEYRTTPDSWRILERRSCCPLTALSPAKWPIPSSCHPFITIPIRGCFECPLIGHARPWSDHSMNPWFKFNNRRSEQKYILRSRGEIQLHFSPTKRKNKSFAHQHPHRYCKLNCGFISLCFMQYQASSSPW